jgi:carbamoyl-phosphate synthase large subunit
MYRWAQSIGQILETGALPLLNKTDLIALCKDKWAFYENISRAQIPYAIESSLSNNFSELCGKFGLPFLIKPRQGFGSKGVALIDCKETFMQYKEYMGITLMAQPLVGTDDEEYTSSAFCDGVGGAYAVMTLRRRLSREGFTDKAEVVSTDEFHLAIERLCEHFQPIGPTNFQFRKCADGIKLLEINPRISSSTSIRTAFGFNESTMSVEYFLNKKIPLQPKITRGRAVRFTEEFIFYEDSLYL